MKKIDNFSSISLKLCLPGQKYRDMVVNTIIIWGCFTCLCPHRRSTLPTILHIENRQAAHEETKHVIPEANTDCVSIQSEGWLSLHHSNISSIETSGFSVHEMACKEITKLRTDSVGKQCQTKYTLYFIFFLDKW